MAGDQERHHMILYFLTFKNEAGNEKQMSGSVCSQCLHRGRKTPILEVLTILGLVF